MSNSWHLGRLAGVDVRIHWTFLLLPAWIYVSNLAAGSGAVAATLAVFFLLAIFGCVVLHELGHSLMARQFGIRTRDITLLPIGGLASLERMPRSPWQELAIALAGPAVNVVIATALFVALPMLAWSALLPELMISFLSNLAWVNVVLVLFNMLPAFPMDGGRVLRATLALAMPYQQATSVAATVGQVFAVALGLLGLASGNFMLLLLAGFVFLAARGEVLMLNQELRQPMGSGRRRTVLLDADGSEIAPIRSQSLPVVSAHCNAIHVLGSLEGEPANEFLVSDRGATVAVVRRGDLQQVVDSGLGAQPIQHLLMGRLLPFRIPDPSTAA